MQTMSATKTAILLLCLTQSVSSFSSSHHTSSFTATSRHSTRRRIHGRKPILYAEPPSRQETADQRSAPKRTVTKTATKNPNNNNNNRNQRPQGGRSSNQQQRRPYSNNNNNNSNNRGNPQFNSSQHQEARQLNTKIATRENALDLLEFLATLKGSLSAHGGGGALNSVNFSTSFHRIARHIAYAFVNRDARSERKRVLADPRFGLLVCSAVEAFIGPMKDSQGAPIRFQSREMSNIVWAIAKIKIAPPTSAMPSLASSANCEQVLEQKAQEVRRLIFQVARNRASGVGDGSDKSWIPILSELSGVFVDTIVHRIKTNGETMTFQVQEWANILWALATMDRVDEEAFTYITNRMITDTRNYNEQPKPQEWSNTIWALATAAISGPEHEMYPYVANIMQSSASFRQEYKPQELSNTAWGVAATLSNNRDGGDQTHAAALTILRVVAAEVIARKGENFKSQEVSNTIWAFATLGFGISNGMIASESEYMVLPSDDPKGDEKLMLEATKALIGRANFILGKFKSQELNNMAWAMARLEIKDQALLKRISMELSDPNRKIQPQDIGTTLWAVAKLEYFEKNAFLGCTSRLVQIPGNNFKPQELSNTCWALATADAFPRFQNAFDTSLLPQNLRPSNRDIQSDPISVMFAKAGQELARRPYEFKAQEIKDILWGFSRVDMRHPQLFRSIARYLVENPDRLQEFSPQGIGNMAWAYARQAQLSANVIHKYGNRVLIPHTSGRLAVYLTSFIDIGEALLQDVYNAFTEVAMTKYNGLANLKPQDVANTAWALAVLGLKHPTFLEMATKQMVTRLEDSLQANQSQNSMLFVKGQEVANVVWAIAYLNWRPNEQLLHAISKPIVTRARDSRTGKLTVESIAKCFKRQELANIGWACAVLGEYPPELMHMVYMGLFGVGQNTDPSFMEHVYQDMGVQYSLINSMMYLQLAMDLEGVSIPGLELPPNFPEGWEGQGDNDAANNNLLDDGLLLKTSKIQRDVADALARIGFPGVEEHCITMRQLASSEVGAQLTPLDRELLSIDIADPIRKIGIEVDGPAHWISRLDSGIRPQGKYTQTQNGKAEYVFNWGNAQEMNGPTVLKLRLLDQLGWTMITVPFWDWYKMEGDRQAEDEYLLDLFVDAKQSVS